MRAPKVSCLIPTAVSGTCTSDQTFSSCWWVFCSLEKRKSVPAVGLKLMNWNTQMFSAGSCNLCWKKNSSVMWSWMVTVSLLHPWYDQQKVRHLMRKMEYMAGQKLLSNYYTCFGIIRKLVTLYLCSLVSYPKPQTGIIFEHCKQIILLSSCGRNEQFLNCTLLNIVAEEPIYPGGRRWAHIS